jgi:hypothetical protein
MLLALLLLFGQIERRDAAMFLLRAAELDAREATLKLAASEDSRSVATLDWLRALGSVLKSIPIERATGPYEEWLKTHEDLIVYSEPAGEWLIRHDLISDLHKRFANAPSRTSSRGLRRRMDCLANAKGMCRATRRFSIRFTANTCNAIRMARIATRR